MRALRHYTSTQQLKAFGASLLILSPIFGVTALTCATCAPVDQSHIEVFTDTYGTLRLERNLRTGEIRLMATVSIPAICEGDSTNLDMDYELGGIPTTELSDDGDAIYSLHELAETYMKAVAFMFMEDGTILLKTGACLNVPCEPNCVQGVFRLEKAVIQ